MPITRQAAVCFKKLALGAPAACRRVPGQQSASEPARCRRSQWKGWQQSRRAGTNQTYQTNHMSLPPKNKLIVEVHPLTPRRWPDFEKLFGKNGACAGCWCMWWRLPAAQWRAQKGEGNRDAMRKLVKDGARPGLLAYVAGEAVGWCAVSPRQHCARFAASRVLKPVDEQPVWSVTCFFVARAFRRRGVTRQLLEAAAAFASAQGADILEGYPIEPQHDQPDVFVYTGLASTFRKTGFKEIARRSPSRPIFRRRLQPSRRA